MRLSWGVEKGIVTALGGLSVLLVFNLAREYRAMQPGHSHDYRAIASGPSPRGVKAAARAHAADDLAKYNPDVHLGALKAQDARPLPDDDRDPFAGLGGPAAPGPVAHGGPAPPPVVAAPPPPPPLPLKAVGYNQLPNGKGEAMVTFNDDLNVVHEGDVIGGKFKVAKITPTSVVVEDGDTHKTIELPIEQQ